MRVLIRDSKGELNLIEVQIATYVEEAFDDTIIKAVTMASADSSVMIAVYVDSIEEGEKILADFAKDGYLDLSEDDRAQFELFEDLCECEDDDCDCGCDHMHQ